MYRLKILILISIFFLGVNYSFAQIKVSIHHPPPNRLNQADLWNITIINSGQSVSAYLFGSMTNNENGELIATGQTVSFEVKKGTTNFKVSDLPSIPDINYLSKDPKYKTSFMNTGGAPPGDYKICVELRYTNNSVAGEDCIEQKVIGGDAPQLISPRDEEELKMDNPVFTWMHMKAPGSEQSYTLKIVELKGDESPENAMLKNKAFFEKEGITQQMLQYPSSAPKLEEGKKYAWQIYVVQSDAIIIKSEANLFTNKNIVSKTPPVTLTLGTNDCLNNNFSFFDDYSDDDPWMPIAKGNVIGTGPYDITGCNPRNSSISSSSFVKVNGGHCKFQNVTEEGNDYRTFRKFTGDFKTNFENSTCWEAKFEFSFSALGADNRVGHPIFALTADSPESGGPWNPINYSNADNSVPQSAFCNFSNQDAIMVWLWLPTTAYYNAHPEISPIPPVGTRKAAFFPWCKKGTELDLYIPSTTPIYVDPGTYFIKLERIDATKGKISVYSDNTYSNTSLISVQCFDIPLGMGKLNTLQHSNAPDGVGRELTGTLDNTCIKILNPGSISCGTTTPPSNCNSDCKLITADLSICQTMSPFQLRTYIGKYSGKLEPKFNNPNPNYFGWPTQPDLPNAPYFSSITGKKYVIKATGGYSTQWSGLTYDAAFQFTGSWTSTYTPYCRGFSQFMLTGNQLNLVTRPVYPFANLPNFNYHEYLYEYSGDGTQVGYLNPNNACGGSVGTCSGIFSFYELCDTNNYMVNWIPIANPSLPTLTGCRPIFTPPSTGTFNYNLQLTCRTDNSISDTKDVRIFVSGVANCIPTNQIVFPPDCGCGFWQGISYKINNGSSSTIENNGLVTMHHNDVIKFTPSYIFNSNGSCNNDLYMWILKSLTSYDNSILTPDWVYPPSIVEGPRFNNQEVTFSPLNPGWYIVRLNPQGGSTPKFNCPERNFVIHVIP